MKKFGFHKLALMMVLTGSLLISGCLPEEKEVTDTSDAGKLSGAYYAAGLGNLALQIQNKIVTDPTWFSPQARTMELPLQTMKLFTANLGTPIRSYVCPTGTGTEVFQLTWLDGDNKDGKFTLKGIGTDTAGIITDLRKRAGGQHVGIYKSGTSIEMADGRMLDIPPSCGAIPIPPNAPVVAFSIERPAKPAVKTTRTEYQTLPCEAAQTGAKVQSRVISYEVDGTVIIGVWKDEDLGQCIDKVTVGATLAFSDKASSQLTGGTGLNASFRELLARQLKMGCLDVKISSNIRKDKEFSTCNGTTVEGKTALTAVSGDNAIDSRTLSCADTAEAPLTGIINVGDGIKTKYTWESGHAVIVRRITANDMNDGSTDTNAIDFWEGSDKPGDLTCAGFEEVEVPCEAITEGRAAYVPQQDGNMWHNFNSNPTNHYNVSVWAMSRQYFTGTFQYKNGVVKLRRPISASVWADKKAFKPRVDGQTWTVVKNECVVAKRALYPENGCAPVFKADDANNPTGNWYPSQGAGYRPKTIIDMPIQFTGDANTLPSRFQELRNMGYLPQQGSDLLINPVYLYKYPFGGYPVDMKQWTGNNTHDTLIGLNGIMYGQSPKVVNNNKLVYPPLDKNHFAEPFTCGRDEVSYSVANGIVYSGTMSNYTTHPMPVGVTVNTYREWRGYAYDNGSWSQPSISYTPQQGYWSGNMVIVDQRTPDPVPEDVYTPPSYTDMGGAP